jgi:predicted nucleic acid-binding protein
MVNPDALARRLLALSESLGELSRPDAASVERLATDSVLRAAVERWLQTAIEACIDIASHVIDWAAELLVSLRGPWITAEACISESIFLLEQAGPATVETLCSWIDKGLLLSCHFLPGELQAVRRELFAYRNRWIDFADACLVCLSDRYPRLPVASVDAADFAVYFRRRAGRRLHLPTSIGPVLK